MGLKPVLIVFPESELPGAQFIIQGGVKGGSWAEIVPVIHLRKPKNRVRLLKPGV
jgi:hypothetical protein